jgi:3-deoxy-manno-octulosonate cytidylyltransferase (CMP-KDO synthetase)
VLPARYASTRLPGKILKTIAGKTLIERVYDCVKESSARQIIIATDDQRIVAEAERMRASVCLTSNKHESGTQRIAEVLTTMNIPMDTIVVNVQGDEPFMPSSCIDQVANLLQHDDTIEMATLCTPLLDNQQINDSNVVKVVLNHKNEAMYFSRASIPWYRDAYENKQYTPEHLKSTFRHIGIYAYRARFVHQYVQYPACQLEEIEKLEQLRALWYGHTIKVAQAVEIPGPGIDTQEDLLRAEKLLKNE